MVNKNITTEREQIHQYIQIEDEPLQDIQIEDEPLQDIQIEGEPLQDIQIEDEPLQDIQTEDEPLQDIQIEGEPLQDIQTEDEPLQDIQIEDEPINTQKILIPKPKRKEVLKKTSKKNTKINIQQDIADVDLTQAMIRSQRVVDRLPKEREKVIVKAPSYYMSNRKIFIQKFTELFKPYQKELLDVNKKVSCDTSNVTNEFDLLTHQKIVRDYLNLYTPYRGLLLYHGLGSGKTCTSIAIAEGMKTDKHVYVLTPAALQMNFLSELKKCGDHLYKKNQYWEFISIDGQPEYIPILSKALLLPVDIIKTQKGAWLMNVNKETNYEELSVNEKKSLDNQLNRMIRTKYTNLNYNGMNLKSLEKISKEKGQSNIFDNSVIIIDEAHNLVSRIVNKIKINDKKTISYKLYDDIMRATNAKVVLLSGTPIINYPNEIGVLYNLLRGYITSWTIPTELKHGKINTEMIINMLDDANMKTYDLIEYSDNKLTVTRNPFGFINTKKRGVLKGTKKTVQTKKNEKKINNKTKRNTQTQKGGEYAFEKYNGVKLDDTGNISNNEFIQNIMNILTKNGINVKTNQIVMTNHKSLPDDSNTFLSTFVDTDNGNTTNINLFQRRIIGLTSYFRSAQEDLLPSYEQTEDGDNYHIVKVEMSEHQFAIYEKIRKIEHDKEKKTQRASRMQKGNELYKMSSTYRIFSRAACNFAFPNTIERPVPVIKDKVINEKMLDAEQESNEISERVDTENIEDQGITNVQEHENYTKRIDIAMNKLNSNKDGTNEKEYLSKLELTNYSPKFAKILENITDVNNKGLHLVYSHFRTMEGIGILKLILLANGYAEFKIKKINGIWELIENSDDIGKPKFVLYTGTEQEEEKEIIRNVYNSMWEYVPLSITSKIKQINENNHMGEIIKVMMITASGAEGINLKNTRYVHIVEPYWHMVRVEQVIGRARRICSHQDLPINLRTVKVFLYISSFSAKQKTDDNNIELRIRDVSKVDRNTPITTDESLYEISSIKQRINNQILNAIKESAIDCNLYSNVAANKQGEQLVCYGYGKVQSNQFSSYPMFEKDLQNKKGLDTKKITWTGIEMTANGVVYIVNRETNEVYDYNSYIRAKELNTELLLVGKLIEKDGKLVFDKNI